MRRKPTRNLPLLVISGPSLTECLCIQGQSNMGMQVGPSVRGFDADNATAEGAASGVSAAPCIG